MTNLSAPAVHCIDGVFVVEPGPEYSRLYEPMLDNLAVLKQLAESADSCRVVFDMQHVDLIGSALIGYLLSAGRTLANRGGALTLANANRFCQTAINLTQLKSMLPIYDSTLMAVDAAKRVGQIFPTADMNQR